MLQLLEHPLSSYVQKVKIALREKGLDFEAHMPEGMGTGETHGEHAIQTVRGEIPVLIDDGERIFDSTIILEYIEQKWPEPRLLPADPAAAARARMVEDMMDTHYEAINWGLVELRYFGRGDEKSREEIRGVAKGQIAAFHGWLEGQLNGSGWFNGAEFGWADLSVVPYLNTSAMLDFPPPPGSRLEAWLNRVNERPSVAETEKEALATVPGMVHFKDALDAGLLRREYRDHRLEWMMKSGGLPIVLDGLEKNNIRFSIEALDGK